MHPGQLEMAASAALQAAGEAWLSLEGGPWLGPPLALRVHDDKTTTISHTPSLLL